VAVAREARTVTEAAAWPTGRSLVDDRSGLCHARSVSLASWD
jgi:hypothetical protein